MPSVDALCMPTMENQPSIMKRAVHFARSLLMDWRWYRWLAALLLLGEAALGVLLLTIAPNRYTEIDWIAYMQEVEGWLGGELDYTKLRGDTGPLVYPAGFVYLYSGLRWLTGGGRGPAAVRVAQWVFLAVYLVNHALVLDIYGRTRPGPPWIAILLSVSKRLHSLYFLRLFNDCWAMLAVHACLAAVARGWWAAASVLLSLGVSVKMNGLLMAPAFGLLLLRNVGLWRTLVLLAVMAGIQVGLGWPFLAAYPAQYLGKAFELGRVFFHQWTVNWKFLPEETFVSQGWATALLAGHLGTLALLALTAWTADDGGLWTVLGRVLSQAFGTAPADSKDGKGKTSAPYRDGPAYSIYLLWASNYIGIVFSRTLHYQFLTWYWASLPFLLWRTRLPLALKLAVLAAVEYGFNVGDETGAGSPLSSAVLQAGHFLLLAGLLFAPDAVPYPVARYCHALPDEPDDEAVADMYQRYQARAVDEEDEGEGQNGKERKGTKTAARKAVRTAAPAPPVPSQPESTEDLVKKALRRGRKAE